PRTRERSSWSTSTVPATGSTRGPSPARPSPASSRRRASSTRCSASPSRASPRSPRAKPKLPPRARPRASDPHRHPPDAEYGRLNAEWPEAIRSVLHSRSAFSQMPLRIDIVTLFPELYAPLLSTSIPRRAADKGLVSYHITDIRAFGEGNYNKVDD